MVSVKEVMESFKGFIEVIAKGNGKLTNGAYGWSDDTLIIYKEESSKHMFFVCLDKNKELSSERPFLYYIPANTYIPQNFVSESIKIGFNDKVKELTNLSEFKPVETHA